MSSKAERLLEERAKDSVEWMRDHRGKGYQNANSCEKCYLGGLAFGLAALKGTTQEIEYQRLTKPKTKKRVVVRRKK